MVHDDFLHNLPLRRVSVELSAPEVELGEEFEYIHVLLGSGRDVYRRSTELETPHGSPSSPRPVRMHHIAWFRVGHRELVQNGRALEPVAGLPERECGVWGDCQSEYVWNWGACGEVYEWTCGLEVYFAVSGGVYGCAEFGLFWVAWESEGGEVVDGGGEEDCVGFLPSPFPPFP